MLEDNNFLSCISYNDIYDNKDLKIAKCSNNYEKMSQLIDKIISKEIKFEKGVEYDFEMMAKELPNSELKKLDNYCIKKTGKSFSKFIESNRIEIVSLPLNVMELPKNYDKNKNYEVYLTLDNNKENQKRIIEFSKNSPKNIKYHFDLVESKEKTINKNNSYKFYILAILIIIFILIIFYIYWNRDKKQ